MSSMFKFGRKPKVIEEEEVLRAIGSYIYSLQEILYGIWNARCVREGGGFHQSQILTNQEIAREVQAHLNALLERRMVVCQTLGGRAYYKKNQAEGKL